MDVVVFPAVGVAPVDEDVARSNLSGTRFGQLSVVEATGSTNDDLAAQARSGAGERVLITRHQQSGRGRGEGRTWEAPPDTGLLMSILARPGVPTETTPQLTLALALAARAAIGGDDVTIKWPNDLVVRGRGKLAGVLAELVTAGDGPPAVVAGIGINLALPPEAAAPGSNPVSLVDLGAEVDATALAVGVVRGFADRLATLEGGRSLHDELVAASSSVGRRVRLEHGDHAGRIGTVTDLGSDGSLVVALDGETGPPVRLTAGEARELDGP